MAIDPSEARLKFLRQAAYELSIAAPAISAALSSTCSKSIIDNEQGLKRAKKEWDTLWRESCGACGNIMLPGWTNSVGHQSRLVVAKKQIVSTCLRCDRKSVQALQSRPPKHISSRFKHKNAKIVTAADSDKSYEEGHDKVIKSANASSKQRKKVRNRGLLAMLEKNKKNDDPGLDLNDFLL